MSKIGKQPIVLLEGVEAQIESKTLTVVGPKGTLTLLVLPFTAVRKEERQLMVVKEGEGTQARANWGTMRALAQNAVIGVHAGFEKLLEIQGIGYSAALEGQALLLRLGFSHPVRFALPEGITVAVEKNVIKISGIDKNLVGLVAAQIRALKKPEPYKGKGIRYQGEVVRRKSGKKVAGAAGGA